MKANIWWLIAGFLSQNFGRWREPTKGAMSFYAVGSVVGTLKYHHMQNNLFELFAPTSGGDAKTSDTSACDRSHHQPPVWNLHNN